jgi:hypothetical protein
MRVKPVVGIILAAALISSSAHAVCSVTFVNGQPAQICDNTLDLPALGVAGIARTVPPSIAPIGMPIIPPIGTTSCREAQVWDGSSYVWRTVCN